MYLVAQRMAILIHLYLQILLPSLPITEFV